MKLYNQINKPLNWDISMTHYSAEPYGEVEVPDKFVEHCKIRGLPLSAVPVPPEIKATHKQEEAAAGAKNDEVANLHKQLKDSVAAEAAAKTELEKSLAMNVTLSNRVAALELDIVNAEDKFGKLVADHSALSKKLDEVSKNLEIKTQEAEKAQAVIAELKKPQQSQNKR